MENTINIKGVICSKEEREFMQMFEPGFSGTTFEDVQEQLSLTTSRNIDLLIDSRGGDIAEGYKIYNLLKASGKKITTKIEFACYSTATFIALVGQKIIINPYARFGIHNPYYPEGCVGGDADQLELHAEELRKYENEFAELYASKTGRGIEEIKSLMKKDSELTAKEALDWGFVDEIAGATETAQAYKHTAAIAYFKTNIKNSNMSEVKLSQEDKSLLKEIGEGIKALFGKSKIKAEGEETPKAEETTTEETPAKTPAELQAENEALKQENETLKAENESLKARIAELEGATEESAKEAAEVKTEIQALSKKFNAMAERLTETYGTDLILAPVAQDLSKGRKKAENNKPSLAGAFLSKNANRIKNK